MLSPFDDFPIHPSADPIAHPATGDINHYDRYWFNGHQRDGEFYFGAAMGHYPVRGVIDAAFSIVCDGVEHSIFASGAMPTDRSTTIGPIRVEVVDPMRTIRYVVEPNEHGIACDLLSGPPPSPSRNPASSDARPRESCSPITRVLPSGVPGKARSPSTATSCRSTPPRFRARGIAPGGCARLVTRSR